MRKKIALATVAAALAAVTILAVQVRRQAVADLADEARFTDDDEEDRLG